MALGEVAGVKGAWEWGPGEGEVAAGEWWKERPRGVSGKSSALWTASAGLYMGAPSDNLSAPTTQAYNKFEVVAAE